MWNESFFEDNFYNFTVKKYPKKTITFRKSKNLEKIHKMESGFWKKRYQRFKMKPIQFFNEINDKKQETELLSSNGIVPPFLLQHISPRSVFRRKNQHILDFQFWFSESGATTNSHYV
jgi:hypothetical protein